MVDDVNTSHSPEKDAHGLISWTTGLVVIVIIVCVRLVHATSLSSDYVTLKLLQVLFHFI